MVKYPVVCDLISEGDCWWSLFHNMLKAHLEEKHILKIGNKDYH